MKAIFHMGLSITDFLVYDFLIFIVIILSGCIYYFQLTIGGVYFRITIGGVYFRIFNI